MSRHQNRQQLELLIGQHGYRPECWGWGGRMGPQRACCDCGVPLGVHHYPDGARCSWCAFWRHMATCAGIERPAEVPAHLRRSLGA